MRRTTTTEAVDDATLVRQIQSGQVAAFAQLMRRYEDRVYNACRRICGDAEDARDLTQETFVKVYRSLGSFQQKSTFYTWLFRIAVNVSLTHRRKHRLRVVSPLPDENGLADSTQAQPAPAGVPTDSRERVAEVLASLEADHRIVLVLRDIEGFDYEQIAGILDVPRGTVKSRVHRARAAMREGLQRRGFGEDG